MRVNGGTVCFLSAQEVQVAVKVLTVLGDDQQRCSGAGSGRPRAVGFMAEKASRRLTSRRWNPVACLTSQLLLPCCISWTVKRSAKVLQRCQKVWSGDKSHVSLNDVTFLQEGQTAQNRPPLCLLYIKAGAGNAAGP